MRDNIRTYPRSFLDSLWGLPQVDAERAVRDRGFKPDAIPAGHGITMEVKPDVILLWLDAKGNVRGATAGDTDQAVP